MKITSVVGARPQFVKLKPIHEALLRSGLDHKVVHTGQHYDPNMSDVFFKGLSLPTPDTNLNVGSGSHGKTTGKMLSLLEEVFIEQEPDFVIVYGDTNSTAAAALGAAKIGIPIGHVEAGLRSRNREMPEEINRVITDHMSDLLFAPTEAALENLSIEGLSTRSAYTGDVMADLLFQLEPTVGQPLNQNIQNIDSEYVVSTIHRASNTDDRYQLETLVDALNRVNEQVLLVAHPRLIDAAKNLGIKLENDKISLIEPLPYLEMLSLVRGAKGLVTDSGGLQKEAFLLGVPCVTLRTETEWIETLENGMNVLCPKGEYLQELINRDIPADSSTPYGDGKAADRIVSLIVDGFA